MTTVLVPAYRPDGRLPALLSALRRLDPHLDLLVVDDGSPGPVLEQCRALGATVLHHAGNRGKGAALRTGFAHVALVSPGSAVVTADADGQHLPGDVVRVAAAVGDGTGVGGAGAGWCWGCGPSAGTTSRCGRGWATGCPPSSCARRPGGRWPTPRPGCAGSPRTCCPGC